MLSTQLIKELDEEERAPLILVVDDIEDHLELMEAILMKEGYRVQTTINVHEAIHLTENQPPDLAILDVMMPVMNGYELCKKLKSISSKKFFPVILVTSLNQLEDKVTGLEIGADDFFSKPFNSIELTTKIRSLIKLKKLQDELENSEDIILTLAVAIETKDLYTKGHSERVGNLSAEFAGFIGLPEREIVTIKKGGILHDIGKIGLNESILHKKTPLSMDEIEIIRKHPTIGIKIVKPLNSLRQTLPIIKYHHERWDGKGFPDKLKGEEIPFAARIVNIVDTFDAMASLRPYRTDLFTKADVIKIMQSERLSGQWDPNLLGKFVEMVEKNPC